ncbi:MAG: hypothetical protein MJ225_04610 [Bacilli bacterium]|nr:hypothetical protein [Bacilli bacterium]
MKRSFRQRIEELGLSYTKEITVLFLIIFVIAVISIVGYIMTKNIIAPGIGLIVGLIITIFYLSRYSSMEKRNDKEHLDELISLLSYLEIFITNKNNVYTSFKMLIPYCSTFMNETINSFLIQVDNDKTVSPYINFAAKFKTKIIESLMLSIYQMVDNGENDKQFDEFNALFSDISKDFYISKVEEHKRSLDSSNAYPLYGAGGIIVILAFSIFSIMGDLVNVI